MLFGCSLHAKQVAAAERLASIVDMTNETVGDAISDMLLVETVLHSRGWLCHDWLLTYTDLPNRLAKVTVKVSAVLYLTNIYTTPIAPITL